MSDQFKLHTSIWHEDAEEDNPFAAKRCLAHGYDVYGEVIHRASWSEYMLLLFTGEKPSTSAATLFEKLAIALANPGPREASVRAAMNGGVGGTTDVGSLIAALGVGAGQYGGAHEVYLLVEAWHRLGQDSAAWCDYLMEPNRNLHEDVWNPIEHPPGFDPHGVTCATPVKQVLEILAEVSQGENLRWLVSQRSHLEQVVGVPMAMSAVAAAAFADLMLTGSQATMLFSMLRLPGAAVHALEQEKLGWKMFPAYGAGIELSDDPGPFSMPDVSRYKL